MKQPTVIQIVGYKGRGKTTLISRLVAALKKEGRRVGVVKHTDHDFQMDRPGTDTWLHQEAGADIVSVASGEQTAVLTQEAKSLERLLADMGHLDMVLIEGWKTALYPKIVLVKESSDTVLIDELDHVIGAACWDDILPVHVPHKYIKDTDGILHMIAEEMK